MFGVKDIAVTLGMVFRLPAQYDLEARFPADLLDKFNIPLKLGLRHQEERNQPTLRLDDEADSAGFLRPAVEDVGWVSIEPVKKSRVSLALSWDQVQRH